MPLSDDEKAAVRYHLGYGDVEPASSITFGQPTLMQTNFLLESSLDRVSERAVPRIRIIIGYMEGIDRKLVEAQERLAASQLGDMTLRGSTRGETEPDLLEREYVRWAYRLADIFRCPVYAYSARFRVGVRAGNVHVGG